MWINNLGYQVEETDRTLKVEIHGVKDGIIEFSLIAGDQRFDTHFTHHSDPIHDLRRWLEALSANVYQATFYYNTRYHAVIWRCTFATIFDHVMEVVQYDRNGEQRMMTFNVYRHEVIRVIYEAFLNFFGSDRYDPLHWEEERLLERLERQYNMEKEELCHYLSQFDSKELGQLLFRAGYEFLLTFPDTEEPYEKRMGLLAALRSGVPWDDPILESYGLKMEFDIEDKYEGMSRNNRACRISGLLYTPATEFRAEKPEILRSPIVDRFLALPDIDLF